MGSRQDPIAGGGQRAGAPGPVWRYAVACLVVGLAFALRMALARYFGPPYILFYPAVMLVALLAGLGPGLLATALSAVLALGWVLPSESTDHALGVRDLVSLAVFAAMGACMSWVAERARSRVTRRALDEVVREREARGQAEAEARLAARRHAYLVALSDALRTVADPAEVQRQAARLLGEALGASRVHYAEVVEEGRYGLVRADYSAGLPSVVGRHRFDDYGPAVMNEFRAGRTLVVADVQRDERLTPQERAATAALSVGAYVIFPLIKAGHPVAVLVAHQDVPRDWTPHEVELIGETAERTWAAVERAHAEGALRESEQRFRRAVHEAPFPVMMHAEDGEVLSVNRTWTELTGYAHQDIPTTSAWLGRAYGSRQQEVLEQVQSLYGRETRLVAGERQVRCRDGSLRTWDFSAVGLGQLPDGRRIALTMAADVTDRRKSEAERARLEGQLHQAHKMEAVGRLAGGIAHDFNNMLGVILGHTDLALEQVEPGGPLRADLEEIGRAARRSADLTRQLLAFARKQAIAPVALDLNATVEGMLKMLQRLLGEHIQLTWRPAASPWAVRMDPSQVDQLLANLCVNARDAIGQAGRLTIETENVTLDEAACSARGEGAPGDWVRLSVSDDGCGMDRETLARLFEPFFTTKEPGKGTGLGLATLYGIVKQNGGFVSVHSEPGVGTTFGIYLPRHLGEAVAAPRGEAPPPVRRGRETVLVVEDEPAILGVTRRMLEAQGYRVLAAASPEEALRLAREHAGKVDLLLTDVVMPGMNGRELARGLLEQHAGLKQLFMSGYTADVVAHQGVLADGLHFIQKPFTSDGLASAVRAALDSGR